ncbi:MAG: sensor histidine kinase [Ramlibacter sp.]|nr:sensor histidine kinase [Ramlibacter sp.]
MQDLIAQTPAQQGTPDGAYPRRSLARHLSEVQLLLDQAPSFLALTQGPAHHVVLANETCLRLVRRRREDLIGRPILEAVPELEDQGLGLLLDDVLKTEKQRTGSAVKLRLGPTKDPATDRMVDFILQPILDVTNSTVGIVIQGLDVTDRESAVEALRQADRAKDDFLATLAHELLTPLSASRVALELLGRSLEGASATPAVTRHLGVLRRQQSNIMSLVEDLLDVSRVKLGKISLHTEEVVLQEAVRAAAETCQHVLDARSHSLQLQLPEALLTVAADPRRLIQALTNVLTNAAKYTEPGGKISIEVRRNEDVAEITVADNGRGMTPQELESAFDLFQQNCKEDSARGGLGIGLALVRQLVELQGGRVRAASPGNRAGTAITICLPAMRNAGVPSTPSARAQ